MKTKKKTTKILLVLAVALLATFVSYSAFNHMERRISDQNKLITLMQNTQEKMQKPDAYTYAYALKDLNAGELVSEEDIDFKEFEKEDKSAFDASDEVINKILLADIKSGEPFTTAQIAKISNDESIIRKGYRGLTLPAESFTGRASSMKVGTQVDLYAADSDSTWELAGVKIISAEGATALTPANSAADAKSITFEVPAADIADFISHVSKSKIVLVSKNPSEKTVRRPKKIVSEELPVLPKINYDSISGLPMPLAPSVNEIAAPQVELIEANVKTKVTFE